MLTGFAGYSGNRGVGWGGVGIEGGEELWAVGTLRVTGYGRSG